MNEPAKPTNGSFRRLIRNKRKTLEDPAVRAANRLRGQLDRKEYIAYRDVGLVVNAYLEIIERYKESEAIGDSIAQSLRNGFDQSDKRAMIQTSHNETE